MTATLINGRVLYAASSPKDYGHGPRINVVVEPLTGGDGIKVWDKADSALARLRKGEQVQLLYDGKAYKLVETQQAPLTMASQIPQPQQTQTPESAEEAFDQMLRQSASRYAKAVKLAKALAQRELGLSEQALSTLDGAAICKEIATGLFIEASRRSR